MLVCVRTIGKQISHPTMAFAISMSNVFCPVLFTDRRSNEAGNISSSFVTAVAIVPATAASVASPAVSVQLM